MGALDLSAITSSDIVMNNLYEELLYFTDPANAFGFRSRFCFWVATQWRNDVHYPDPTLPGSHSVPLMGLCQNVTDVLASFNGRVLRGAVGNPILERRWDDANALFEDACIEYIENYRAAQIRNAFDPVTQELAGYDWMSAIYRGRRINDAFDYWADRIRDKFSDGSEYFRSLYGDEGFGLATLAELQALLKEGVIEHG